MFAACEGLDAGRCDLSEVLWERMPDATGFCGQGLANETYGDACAVYSWTEGAPFWYAHGRDAEGESVWDGMASDGETVWVFWQDSTTGDRSVRASVCEAARDAGGVLVCDELAEEVEVWCEGA